MSKRGAATRADNSITRRQALQRAGWVGAGMALVRVPGLERALRWQGREMLVAGEPVQVAVSEVSDATVRISVLPAASSGPSPIPLDGALVETTFSPHRWMRSPGGDASVGRFAIDVGGNPVTVRVSDGEKGATQELAVDPDTGALSFSMGDCPLLGMGEGGRHTVGTKR